VHPGDLAGGVSDLEMTLLFYCRESPFWFESSGTCLYGGCKWPVSVKRDVKIEANLIISECAAYYRVVAYY